MNFLNSLNYLILVIVKEPVDKQNKFNIHFVFKVFGHSPPVDKAGSLKLAPLEKSILDVLNDLF